MAKSRASLEPKAPTGGACVLLQSSAMPRCWLGAAYREGGLRANVGVDDKRQQIVNVLPAAGERAERLSPLSTGHLKSKSPFLLLTP